MKLSIKGFLSKCDQIRRRLCDTQYAAAHVITNNVAQLQTIITFSMATTLWVFIKCSLTTDLWSCGRLPIQIDNGVIVNRVSDFWFKILKMRSFLKKHAAFPCSTSVLLQHWCQIHQTKTFSNKSVIVFIVMKQVKFVEDSL